MAPQNKNYLHAEEKLYFVAAFSQIAMLYLFCSQQWWHYWWKT